MTGMQWETPEMGWFQPRQFHSCSPQWHSHPEHLCWVLAPVSAQKISPGTRKGQAVLCPLGNGVLGGALGLSLPILGQPQPWHSSPKPRAPLCSCCAGTMRAPLLLSLQPSLFMRGLIKRFCGQLFPVGQFRRK